MSFYSQLPWMLLNGATIISQLLMITLTIKILQLSKASDHDSDTKTLDEYPMETARHHPTTVPTILPSLPLANSFKPSLVELENGTPKHPLVSYETAVEANSRFLQDLIPYTSNGDDEPYPNPRSPCNHSHTFPNYDKTPRSPTTSLAATRRHTSDNYVGSEIKSGKNRKNIRFIARLREWSSVKRREADQ